MLLQRTGKTFIRWQERHSTDRPIRRQSLRQQSVDDERLMSTMEVAHPDVPSPFREIGPVDGSFGPFENLQGRTTADGAPLSWINGAWGNKSRELRVHSQDDRDQTPDEINGDWAVANLPPETLVLNSHSAPQTPVSRLEKYRQSQACKAVSD